MTRPLAATNTLRRIGVAAAIGGAIGCLGLLVIVGRETTSWLLAVLFIGWILTPFALLGILDHLLNRSPLTVRRTIHTTMVAVASVNVAFYARRVLIPPEGPAAFIFVITPPLSCACIAVAVGIAAMVARRRSGDPA